MLNASEDVKDLEAEVLVVTALLVTVAFKLTALWKEIKHGGR